MPKKIPDKLTINLTERLPFFVIFYKNGYFLIDNEGVVIEKITDNKERYKDLLIVKDTINYTPVLGEKIARKNVISSAIIYNTFSGEIKGRIKYASIGNEFSGDIIFE